MTLGYSLNLRQAMRALLDCVAEVVAELMCMRELSRDIKRKTWTRMFDSLPPVAGVLSVSVQGSVAINPESVFLWPGE